jgi:spore germination cell wall hydrolase CwlJ-like protein
MFRSVRTGGLAVALFATLAGGTTASAQDIPAPAAPVQQAVFVSQPVVAALPAATPAETAPAATAQAAAPQVKRSLAALTAENAGSATAGADHECLAVAVYFEARGETLEGQLAVAEVVLNRAASGQYPAEVCAVVKQKAQFSFVRNGQFPSADRASAAWKKAVAIAKIAQAELADELPKNVLWYHADYVAPSWGKRLTRQAKIGTHIFYS